MQALNAARVHVLAGSGWIRSPGVGEVTSSFPWGSSPGWTFLLHVQETASLGDGQLLSS